MAYEEVLGEAHRLWGEEKWDALYDLFVKNKLNEIENVIWPPFNGFSRINKKINASEFTYSVDRFQKFPSLGGGFGSPILKSTEGVDDLSYTYDSRMLADKLQNGDYYFKFQPSSLSETLEISYGDVMPWFNKKNNLAGEQVQFSEKLHNLADSSFPRGSLQAKQRVLGDWRNCVVKGKSVVTDLQKVFNKLPKPMADDLVNFINDTDKMLGLFQDAQKNGKLEVLIRAYEKFWKHGIKKPCL